MKKNWSCHVSVWNARFWREYQIVVEAGSLAVAAKVAVKAALDSLPARTRITEIRLTIKKTDLEVSGLIKKLLYKE
jgi:hypothetical protein